MKFTVTMNDVKQIVALLLVGAMGIIAACHQNWTLVGSFATGFFALLHFSSKGESAPNNQAS